jgi:hypothetical protein
MRGELLGALLLFKLFFLASIRREMEIVRKMEMANAGGDCRWRWEEGAMEIQLLRAFEIEIKECKV